MNIVIRDSPLGLFYYRQKPVTAGLGRPCQNYLFIAPFRPQDWFFLFPESYGNWFRGEYNQLLTDLSTTEINQIPIVSDTPKYPAYAPRLPPRGLQLADGLPGHRHGTPG
jgi:hypothetical protein